MYLIVIEIFKTPINALSSDGQLKKLCFYPDEYDVFSVLSPVSRESISS